MKFIKNNIKLVIGFILGVILASSVTVYAYSYFASEIEYKREGTDINTVADALDDLYAKSNIDNYNNKTYTLDGLVVYQNRVTIKNGGYYVDPDGITWVNITFDLNIDIGSQDEKLLIYGFPNLDGSRIVSDVDGIAPFRIGSWIENSSYKNRIDLSNDYYGSVTANTEFTLQFKY